MIPTVIIYMYIQAATEVTRQTSLTGLLAHSNYTWLDKRHEASAEARLLPPLQYKRLVLLRLN